MATPNGHQLVLSDRFSDREFISLCREMGLPDYVLEEEPDPYSFELLSPETLQDIDLIWAH